MIHGEIGSQVDPNFPKKHPQQGGVSKVQKPLEYIYGVIAAPWFPESIQVPFEIPPVKQGWYRHDQEHEKDLLYIALIG